LSHFAVKILTHMFATSLEEHKNSVGYSEALDLPSLLLKPHDDPERYHNYTFREMMGESFSIFGAGHDTTAVAASFLIHALATHPEIQDKVREEIQTISGNSPTYIPTYEDLKKMKYIDAVLEESFRLYPPANVLVR